VLRRRIERTQRRHRRAQHRHRMRVLTEPFHELLDVLVHVRVVRDVLHPLVVLGLRWKLAVTEQPRDLEEIRLPRELVDRVSAVPQDALVAVDERDRTSARRGVHERRIVSHQSEVTGLDLDLLQVRRANGVVSDWDRVGLAGAGILDLEVVAYGGSCFPDDGSFLRTRHGSFPCAPMSMPFNGRVALPPRSYTPES